MLHRPQCGAEYREGYSSCADCHVFLVRERPEKTEGITDHPGDPNQDPFRSIWQGNLARYAREYGDLFEQAGIPYKVIHREDHLFNLSSQPKFEVAVPVSRYEEAIRAVEAKYGTEDEIDENEEVPLPDFEFPSPVEGNQASRFRFEDWFPEDAIVEVWSGSPSDMQEMIEMSLRENEIHTRWVESEMKMTLFVLPADEIRAREIVREIVETTAPE